MKCEYCGGFDHLESSCPTKKGDRRTELGMAWLFLLALAPFWLIGMLFGFIRSAWKAGREFGDGAWPQALDGIRGKKPDVE